MKPISENQSKTINWNDPEQVREYKREWNKQKRRERGLQKVGRKALPKEQLRENKKAYWYADYAADPVRYNARGKLNRAVKSGKVVKQPCLICGSNKVEGHHPDYNIPLGVIWLCHAHHRYTHEANL